MQRRPAGERARAARHGARARARRRHAPRECRPDALSSSARARAQAMKFLQQAVGLRGYAQRDPLAEYKLEGYALFLEMMAAIRRNPIYNVYMFRLQAQPQPAGAPGGGGRRAACGGRGQAAPGGNGAGRQPAEKELAGARKK